jgi:hypothetical protein
VPPSFPALETDLFEQQTPERLSVREPSQHKPRFLML